MTELELIRWILGILIAAGAMALTVLYFFRSEPFVMSNIGLTDASVKSDLPDEDRSQLQSTLLKIKDVDYCGDYTLELLFSNGERRTVNLFPYLEGEVFGELRDIDKFTQYGLTRVTIEWANGADFAPEFLYEIGIPIAARS